VFSKFPANESLGRTGLHLSLSAKSRARICKRLWSPEIASEESISPAYVAWRASNTNRVLYRPASLRIDTWSPYKIYKYGLSFYLPAFEISRSCRTAPVQRLEFQRITAKQTQVHLRLSRGSVHGSCFSNIELGGLNRTVLSVHIMCMHRWARPRSASGDRTSD
jgi:hypothetical protein